MKTEEDLSTEDEEFDDDELENAEEEENTGEEEITEEKEIEEKEEVEEEVEEKSVSNNHSKNLSRKNLLRKKRWGETVGKDGLNYAMVLDHAKDPFLMKYLDQFAEDNGYEDGSELLQEAVYMDKKANKRSPNDKSSKIDIMWEEMQKSNKKKEKETLSQSKTKADEYLKESIENLNIDKATYEVEYKPFFNKKRREYILDGLSYEKSTKQAMKDVKLSIFEEKPPVKEKSEQLYSKKNSSNIVNNTTKTHKFKGVVARGEFYQWDKEKRMAYRKSYKTKDGLISFSG